MNPGPQPMPEAPANETLEQFIERREKELLARVSALRGQLNPAEAELAQSQQMKAVIEQRASGANLLLPQRNYNSQLEPALGVVPAAELGGLAALNQIGPPSWGVANPRFANATIKELVIQALLDGFPHGATT